MKLLSSLLVVSLLCVGVGLASSQTTSQILTGNWQVNPNAPITCDQTTCCCFNGAVNGYVKNNDNYLNGTAVGQCRKATQSDNLDPPAGYVWTAEFLGIDNAAFTLTNMTLNGVVGYSLTMNTSGPAVTSTKQKCGFQLFQANPAGLPATPTPLTTPPPSTAAYVTQFAGTWYADQTCAVSQTTCCCLTNTVTVTMNAAVQTYTINGTASVGCGAPTESDDFPWPVDAHSATNGFTANIFPTADNYTVDYTSGTPNTIFFQDQTKPACSFKLLSSLSNGSTTSPPTTHSGSAAAQASSMLAIAITFLAVLLH